MRDEHVQLRVVQPVILVMGIARIMQREHQRDSGTL
jgi:hypothetical protein